MVQEQQLRHDQVCDLVIDRRTKKNNAFLEEQRINIIGTLAAAGNSITMGMTFRLGSIRAF